MLINPLFVHINLAVHYFPVYHFLFVLDLLLFLFSYPSSSTLLHMQPLGKWKLLVFVTSTLWLVLVPSPVHSFRQKQTSTTVRGISNTNTMCKDTPNDSSSVLRELKEKIKHQSKEIETLKRRLKSDGGGASTGSSSSGGAHGGGPEMQTDEYLSSPFYKIASHRVGWLSLFLCSLSLTALIMNGFENTLHRQLELAYFVPYVLQSSNHPLSNTCFV